MKKLLQSITNSNVLFHLQTLKCFDFQACPLTFRLVLWNLKHFDSIIMNTIFFKVIFSWKFE